LASYLDGTKLSGFVGEDVVALGRFRARARFGCITAARGAGAGGAEIPFDHGGILGLGFPRCASSIARPLLYELSNQTSSPCPEADGANPMEDGATLTARIPARVFTLVLGAPRGQLMFGGYAPASVDGRLVPVPVQKDCDDASAAGGAGGSAGGDDDGSCAFRYYRIRVEQVRLGDALLYDEEWFDYDLTNATATTTAAARITGVLDSGTTCVILPSETAPLPAPARFNESWRQEHLAENGGVDIYRAFRNAHEAAETRAAQLYDMPPLVFRIAGRDFAVPARNGYTIPDYNGGGGGGGEEAAQDTSKSVPHHTCVLSLQRYPRVFLLGDVFLKQVVAVHDLSLEDAPRLWLGDRDEGYPEEQQAAEEPEHRRLEALDLQRKLTDDVVLPEQVDALDGTSLGMLGRGVQYVALLSIGEAPAAQNVSVVVDTGSSILALATPPEGSPAAALALDLAVLSGSLAAAIMLLGLAVGMLRRRHARPVHGGGWTRLSTEDHLGVELAHVQTAFSAEDEDDNDTDEDDKDYV